jgi:orotate phosphoribosyltransferase
MDRWSGTNWQPRCIPPGADVLAGLELGRVPIATALSLRSGLPVVFVRKQAKTYGTSQLAEGRDMGCRCTPCSQLPS